MALGSPGEGFQAVASRNRAGWLLTWYDRVKRPLPWRGHRDPYRVWISEIMLQQTRVETALAHYERFLEAFPNVHSVAAASADEVRAHWSGLGYYRRARSLREAAQRIVARGEFPSTLAGWLELPGVGAYTAAAIMSIVHRARVVALDGNLERVLSRLTAFAGDPKAAAGRRFLARAADPWLDRERPGDSNQALMELGATICRPRRPLCKQCPIAAVCTAVSVGRQEDFPHRRSRRKPIERELLAVVVRQGGRFLVFRRGSDASLLSATWELPWVEVDGSNPAKSLSRRYGGSWILGQRHGSVRHSITHRRLRVTVREGQHIGGLAVADGPEARWTDLAGLDQLAHSSLVRKALLLTCPQS